MRGVEVERSKGSAEYRRAPKAAVGVELHRVRVPMRKWGRVKLGRSEGGGGVKATMEEDRRRA